VCLINDLVTLVRSSQIDQNGIISNLSLSKQVVKWCKIHPATHNNALPGANTSRKDRMGGVAQRDNESSLISVGQSSQCVENENKNASQSILSSRSCSTAITTVVGLNEFLRDP
jgi:hypothetical protein